MLGPVVCDIAGTTLSEAEIKRIAHPLVGMVILFTRNYENRVQLEKLCRAIHDIKPGILIGWITRAAVYNVSARALPKFRR